jgi:hypothetical protein
LSDVRGGLPFLPVAGGRRFKTLQIPTTLPTLDELMGRPAYPLEGLADELLSRLKPGALDVYTIHAEIEGMSMIDWFGRFLDRARERGVEFVSLAAEAAALNARRDVVPFAALEQGEVDGRSGTLAVQGAVLREVAA